MLTSFADSLWAAARDATDWGDKDTTMSFFSFPSYTNNTSVLLTQLYTQYTVVLIIWPNKHKCSQNNYA